MSKIAMHLSKSFAGVRLRQLLGGAYSALMTTVEKSGLYRNRLRNGAVTLAILVLCSLAQCNAYMHLHLTHVDSASAFNIANTTAP